MSAPPPPYVKGHQLLDGKVVIVTAAAGTGIGYATAKRCAEEGATVVISDIHQRRLGEAAERLVSQGGARFRCCATSPSRPTYKTSSPAR